jgi:hypothetical protein
MGMKFERAPRQKRSIYGPFTLWYAEKGGRAVLKGERSWTKINGCQVKIGRWAYSLQFRRAV